MQESIIMATCLHYHLLGKIDSMLGVRHSTVALCLAKIIFCREVLLFFGVLATVLQALTLVSQWARQHPHVNKDSRSSKLSCMLCYYWTAEVLKHVAHGRFPDFSPITCAEQDVRNQNLKQPKNHDKAQHYIFPVPQFDPTWNDH